jgi:hypothetical protein
MVSDLHNDKQSSLPIALLNNSLGTASHINLLRLRVNKQEVEKSNDLLLFNTMLA